MPYLKPPDRSLDIGMIRADNLRRPCPTLGPGLTSTVEA